MFIGHFAVGFAAKRMAPRVSLGVLWLAAQWADTLWPVLVLAGVETVRIVPGITAFTPLDLEHFPWSHSLLMDVLWGVLFGAIVYWRVRSQKAAVVLAALVVSHWVLDWITHRLDMPLWPGSARFGLGLWYSIPATLVVEFAIFGVGVWLYARSTEPRDATGRWGLVGTCVLLVVLYLAAAFGPPPPSVATVAWGSIVGGLLLFILGWWVDAHRQTTLQHG